ncbi:MAG: hypothetical protein IJY44_03760 [Bacteroidaceae bacterium]|nr:hypothetical protein [Bacteroidaceae bacterium]
MKEKGEVFNDFYTNKKALNQTPQMPNGDTQSSARTNDLNALSADKGSDNSSNTQEEEARFRTVEEESIDDVPTQRGSGFFASKATSSVTSPFAAQYFIQQSASENIRKPIALYILFLF